MRYPEFLKQGGRIGFIAPSFGCATSPYIERFDSALSEFERRGFVNVCGDNCRKDAGIGKSNTPEACGTEINDFFLHDKSDVIISCGGGELMCEDLPFVDFDGIKKAAPKWYLGYSDNTNLTFLLPTLTDTASIYGPCVSDFGMKPWHQSIDDAFSLLTGKKKAFSNYDGWEKGWPDREEDPCAPYNITEKYEQVICGGKTEVSFKGRFLGGCLDCLSMLCGTGFDRVKEFNERYKDDGIIWFLESCDLNVMSMRRVLWQLKNAGWFDSAKGFLIGRPLHFEDDFNGFKPHDAYEGILSEFNVPIVMDIDLGHLSPMMPFVSGGYGTVTARENSLMVEYDFSRPE